MKKMLVLLTIMAIVALCATSFAEINPYKPTQTNVPVSVTVEPIAEVFTNTAPVSLNIANFASWSTAPGQVNQEVVRQVNVLTNINATVSAAIEGTIPVSMIFNVLVNPVSGYAGQVIGNNNWNIGAPMLSFSNTDVAAKKAFDVDAMGAGSLPAPTTIGYAAQSVNGLTPPATYNFWVVWSIATR